ncbi:MAG: T9SS type A sorting domain-containing protein [Bacteroidales bacterium]|nr:T9SS type A sorting domain-containing protein [Bacteroidales bacterium]
MKKYYILLSLFISVALSSFGQQVLLQENFNSAAAIPAGWETILNDGTGNPSEWEVGSNLSSASFVIPANDGNYAVSNDNACSCSLLADKIITPSINFTGVTGAFLRFKSFLPSQLYPSDSKGFIFLVDAGNNFIFVDEINTNVSWTTTEIPLTAANGNMRIAFVHSDSLALADFGGWAIDDVQVLVPYSHDLTITSLISPVSGCMTNSEALAISIKNVGTQIANNFSVNYILNGGTPVNHNFTNLGLASGQVHNYTFLDPVNLNGGAANNIVVSVVWANDLNVSNNSLSSIVSRDSTLTVGTIETFNGNTSYMYDVEANAKATASLSNSQAVLGGINAPGWTGGVGNTTAANAWNDNSAFHSSVVLACNGGQVPQINKSLELSFDLRQETGSSVLYNWFGVFVNNVQIADQNGVLNFNPLTQNADIFVTRTFNLSAFKNTAFTLELRASTKNSTDKVFIDNIIVNERNEFDAGVVSILSPESNCGLTATQNLQLTIKNYGLTSLINVPIYYQVDNGTAQLAGIYAGPLAIGATSSTITFNNLPMSALANAGSHTLKVYTFVSGDNLNSSNDYQIINLINQPEIAIFPYEEDFEGNSNWSFSGTNSSWEIGIPAGVEITPTVAGSKALITNADGNYNYNEVSYATSPCFDFTSLSNAYIEFSLNVHSDPEDDGAQIQYSINNGAWTLLGTVPAPPNPTNWYFDNVTSLGNTGGWSAETNEWITASYDLGNAPFANAANVRFRVKFASDNDNTGPLGNVDYDGIAIDNIYIGESQANFDLKANGITAPSSGSNLSNSESISVLVTNTGLQAITSFNVSYQVNALPVVTETFNQAIASGASATVTFSTGADFSTVGTYTITATVDLAADGNVTNNSTSSTIINELLVNTYPYTENFDGLNHQWVSGGVFSSWQLVVPTGTSVVGDPLTSPATDLVWVTNANAGGYYNSENSYVQSPEFDFTNLIEPAVSMRISYNTEPDSDGARLEISTDGGITFSAVGVLATPPNVENWYVNPVDAFGGAAGWTGTRSWVNATQDLTAFAGQASVIFRVYFKADANVSDEGFAFDDFSVIEAAPHDLAVTAWTTQPTGCGLTNAEAITITVQNNGVFAETEFDATYTIDLDGNLVTVTETVSGINLAPNTSMNYTFQQLANFDATGSYVCSATVTIPNDASAGNNTVNEIINSFDVISTFPAVYTFETSDGGWFTGGTNSSFELGVPAAGNTVINAAAEGAKAWVSNLDGSHNASENSYLESQCYNFSGILVPAISFDYIINTEIFNGTIAFDGARLEVSIDGGTTWSVVGNVNDTTNWYNYATISNFNETQGWAGTTASWTHTTYQLDNLANAPSVKFRFAFKTDGFNTSLYEGFGVDNIRIFNDMPNDVAVTAIASLDNCEFINDVDVTITVKNFAVGYTHMAGTQIPVSFTFDGNTYNENLTLAANLAPGETVNYTFTATIDIPAANSYAISATTNLQFDLDGANDEFTTSFNSYATPILSETITNVTCFGLMDGSIALANNPGFTYLWSVNANSAITEGVSNLAAGSYFVTITSGNNCVLEAGPILVTEPTELTASGVYTNATCNGASDGSIDVTINGGTLPYSAIWNAGAYTSEDLSGIGAGVYTLVISDDNSCTETLSFTLIDATSLPLTEAFEGLALPAGWARSQHASSVGWEFGTNINHATLPFFAIPAHTGYAAANDNKNDDFSAALNLATEDRLITPRLDLSGYTHVNLQFDAFFEGFSDIATFEVTMNGGTSWNTVWTLTSNSAWQEDLSINLDAFIDHCDVQFAFKYNDGGEWGNGFAIDNVSIVGTVQPQFDLAATAIIAPAGNSCTFTANEPVTVSVSNLGTDLASGASLALEVNGQTLATEVLPNINSGATINYTFLTGFNFDAAGSYAITASIVWVNDLEAGNNTVSGSLVSYPTISSFPYMEDFNDGDFDAFAVSNGAEASASFAGGALVFAGGNPLIGWTGGASATALNAWNDNTLHQAAGTSYCTIDATNMSSLELLVDVKQVFASSPTNSWFRVLVNGAAVTGNYNPITANDSYQTITVDLDAYLAAPFTLEFQTANNTANDKVYLENILIREKQADIALTGISIGNPVCSFTANETVSVTLVNEGGLPLTGFDLALAVNGFTVATETYLGTIAVGASATYNFTDVDLSSLGQIELVATATLAGDIDNLNNFSNLSIYNTPVYSSYPFIENELNFENYWLAGGTNSSWIFTNGVWETGAGALSYNNNESSAITSPCFDFTNLTDPVVQFDLSYVTENNVDFLKFEYSVNGGAWTTLTNALGATNWTISSGTFALQTLTANTGLGGNSSVKFRVSINSDEADTYTGISFSNFRIFDMPDLTITSITPATVCSDADFNVSMTVKNAGDQLLASGTSLTLAYTINAQTTTETFTLGSDLAAGASTLFVFTNSSVITNVNPYAISAIVTTNFDYNTANNTFNGSVDVIPAPVIGAATNIGLCEGNSITLTATGGVTYVWSGGVVQGVPFFPTQTTTYTVTVTNALGCQATSEVLVEVHPLPVASAGPEQFVCSGSTAVVTATGGTNYQWINGGNTASFSYVVNSTETFSVIVSDANGCSDYAVVTVNELDLPIATVSLDETICLGEEATLIAGGGNSYTWSSGDNTGTALVSPLVTTTYTVTVYSLEMCEDIETVDITVINPPVITVADVAGNHCYQGTEGSIDLTVTGSAPITYTWENNVSTTSSVDNLPAGNYTVTIQDSYGTQCQIVATYTITQPNGAVVATIIDNSGNTGYGIGCNGGNDGSLIAFGMNGTAPFDYVWNNSVNTAINPGLEAGSYTVTVTDFYGCTATSSYMVTEPDAISSTINVTDVTCNGAQNGVISVSTLGGVQPYTYTWGPSNTITATGTLSNLSGGAYTVLVTDANGCTWTGATNVFEPTALSYNTVLQSSYNGYGISCPGGNNGYIEVEGIGGNGNYSFNWSQGATSASLTNLTAGTYTVTITDAKDCSVTHSYILTAPLFMATSTQATMVSCFGGSNGAINLNVLGGVSPYAFVWSSGQLSEDLTGITAGTYTVTISDDNGCTTTKSATITQPSQLVTNATVSSNWHGADVSCPGSADGSATVSVSGGTSPYSYLWTTEGGGITPTVNALGAGTYSVTVTDTKGCTSVSTVTLVDPTPVTATASATSSYGPMAYNVSCFGGNNGSATVLANGGTSPYTYEWSQPSGNLATVNTLTAGLKTITVTDANGCDVTTTVTLTEPSALVADINVVNTISCTNDHDGSLTVLASGGVGVYSYLWSSALGTSSTISGLGAGSYSVTVSDENACTVIDSYTLTNPAPVVADLVITSNYNGYSVSCNGSTDGSLQINASGGTGTYSYHWNHDAANNTNIAVGVPALAYIVTVTDSKGCTASDFVLMTQPDALASVGTLSNYNGSGVSCFGSNDGEISVVTSGGVGALTLNWSNALGNSSSVTGLFAGTYTLSVSDINNCVSSFDYILTEPVALSAVFTSSDFNGFDVSCNGASDGILTVAGVEGTSPYTYVWGDGSTDATISDLTAGIYYVTVTDENDCTFATSFTLIQPEVFAVASVFATSNYDGYNVSCSGNTDGAASLTLSNGIEPFIYEWSNGEVGSSPIELAGGLSSVTVTDANNCEAIGQVILTAPVVFTASAVVTSNYNGLDVTCNGSTNGVIEAMPGTGFAPFTYIWSTGATTKVVSNLGAGTYFVTVTDNHGCETTSSVQVTDAAPISYTFVQENVDCHGNNNGSVDITVNGGTSGNYMYFWSNSTNGEDVNNLAPGMYYFLVIDMNWCHKVSEIFMITEPDQLLVDAQVTSDYNGFGVSCNGSANGEIEATVTGGVQPYTYSWNGNVSGATLSSATAGNYNVLVTDANNCVASASAIVTTPDPIVVDIIASNYHGFNVSCNGAADGIVTASVLSGGVNPFTYSWSGGYSTSQVGNLPVGNYVVVVTDASGCTGTANITLTEPASLNVALSSLASYGGFDVSCSNGADGEVGTVVNGGVGPYTYTWNTGAVTSTVSGLSAGMASVTVSDVNGCLTTGSIILTSPTLLEAEISVSQEITCFGASDGALTVAVNGGFAGYTYMWSTGAVGSMISNVPAGLYSVTVTDALGCNTVAEFEFTSVAPMIMTVDVTNITCNGLTNGSATANVTGGTAPYSFYWNNGSTNSTLTNLSAGLYYGFALDVNNCATNFVPFMVYSPASLSLTANVSNVSCNGNNDGTIDLTVNGGTEPFTYNWSNGANTQNLTGLDGGDFTVTVTDGGNCETISTFTVLEGDAFVVNVVSTDADCQNGGFGSVDMTITGGVQPYTVTWSTGENTEDLAGLSAGTYTVTVLDAGACSFTHTISIANVSPITVSAIGTDVNCYGGNDGAIDLTVGGGSGNYYYNWVGPNYGVSTPFTWDWFNTGANHTILVPPTLDVNLNGSQIAVGDIIGVFYDNNGVLVCGGYAEWTGDVTSIAAWGAETGLDNGFQDGEAYTVKVWQAATGLTYDVTAVFDLAFPNGATYALNGMSGFESLSAAIPSDLSNLTAGTYSVIVSDSQGCTGTATAIVEQPDQLNIAVSSTDISCMNSVDGTVSAIVNGGTGSYSYNWSNGGTDASLVGLSSGTYDLTVMDANMCSMVTSVEVNAPAFFMAGMTINPTYVGGNNGEIDLVVTGDNGPFTYLWSNNATSQDLTGLTEGTYAVTVYVGACSYTAEYILLSGETPDALIVSASDVSQVTCTGGSNGAIDISVSGGVQPYSYNWSNGSQSQDLSGLTAGTYVVTITDAAPIMSTVVETYIISEPVSLMTMTYVTDEATSCLNDGSIDITVEGGTSPYVFNWSNGNTNEDLLAAGGGLYFVEITDANGCTYQSASIGIVSFEMDLSISITPNTCNGGSEATVSVIVNNQLPQSFLWSNNATLDYVENLTAGTYQVTVTDYYGCSVVESVVVTDPNPIVVSIATGSIGFTATVVSGATGPVSYMWSNGKPYQSIKNLVSGTTYCVTVTDANGCTGTACAVWGAASMPMASSLTKDEIVASLTEGDFNLYPNPTQDGNITIGLPAVELDNMLLEVYDNTGRLLFVENYSHLYDSNVSLSLNIRDAGIYHVRMILNNSHAINKRMIVVR